MLYDPDRHHRRSIRLRDYDYAQMGAYFVTICTQNREFLLEPPLVSMMITRWWEEMPLKFPIVSLDAFVLMPNHIHGIIVIDQTLAGMDQVKLGQIIQWFKTMTTNEYIKGVKELGWRPFQGRVWQRNYYEHVIRNDRELQAIRLYIEANPDNWKADEYYNR